MGRNFVLACLEKHVRLLQTLVNANVERKITLTNSMGKTMELFGSGRSIDRLDYSVKIEKLTREVQRLTGLVESKNLKLQSMPGLVEETSRLGQALSKLKSDKKRLTAENKVAVAL